MRESSKLILVINPGSTSKKLSVYSGSQAVAEARFESIGTKEFLVTLKIQREKFEEPISQTEFQKATLWFIHKLKSAQVINDPHDLGAVGLRIVAPGTIFQQHQQIDEEYISLLEKHQNLAPLHISPVLKEIQLIGTKYPGLKMIAVSDSQFHRTIPDVTKYYGIDYDDANKWDLKRFGYHGISMSSITRQLHSACEIYPAKVIACHLGGGASITAIKGGKSIDTSMGLTPLEGLLMNTRGGDLADILTDNDVLVLNDSKVIPARLKGYKTTGKAVEILLLRQETENSWWVMSFPGLKVGSEIECVETDGHLSLRGNVTQRDSFSGQVLIEFNQSGKQLIDVIYLIGQTPIPPYIKRLELGLRSQEQEIREQYQTVFAKELGSAAAPTAGLHFTQDLLNELEAKGVQIEYVTLHVGPGTFQRLWQENIDQNKLHTEWYEIERGVAKRLITAKKKGKRIIAVGTTSTRTLESAYLGLTEDTQSSQVNRTNERTENNTVSKITEGRKWNKNNPLIKKTQGRFKTGWQTTELFINPPYKFKFIDGLITNFHLPESSLLMLVASFTSFPQTEYNFVSFPQSLLGEAYKIAINKRYRFYSFGDAMFIS